VAFELGVDERSELGVAGGQDLGQLLELRDLQTARGQRFGHLEPDIARADDHRLVHLGLLEASHQRERVAHRVQ
jgi:hypothetical protein